IRRTSLSDRFLNVCVGLCGVSQVRVPNPGYSNLLAVGTELSSVKEQSAAYRDVSQINFRLENCFGEVKIAVEMSRAEVHGTRKLSPGEKCSLFYNRIVKRYGLVGAAKHGLIELQHASDRCS